jgi:hypothetical protein
MKIPATAITLATVLAFPVYADTVYTHHTATSINHAHGHTAVFRNRGVYLLEDSGVESANLVPNVQDNWEISY